MLRQNLWEHLLMQIDMQEENVINRNMPRRKQEQPQRLPSRKCCGLARTGMSVGFAQQFGPFIADRLRSIRPARAFLCPRHAELLGVGCGRGGMSEHSSDLCVSLERAGPELPAHLTGKIRCVIGSSGPSWTSSHQTRLPGSPRLQGPPPFSTTELHPPLTHLPLRAPPPLVLLLRQSSAPLFALLPHRAPPPVTQDGMGPMKCLSSCVCMTSCATGEQVCSFSDAAQKCINCNDPVRRDVDRTEGGAVLGGSEEDGWFGNASDSPSESSYGDIPEELRVSPENGPQPEQDASSESSVGCPTPVHHASLELLGLDARVLTTQDTLSSVVSSLYSGDAAQGLGKPLSSNLRRLLEAGSLKLEGGELIGRGAVRGAESPPVGLALSPSSRHAQQLSALARRLAGNSASAPPASVPVVKQEPSDPFSPAEAGGGSGGAGFMWVGMGDAWLAASCSGVSGSSLSPDSAIQKLKAAANAVLQDKGTVTSSGSASSSSSSSSSSVTSSSAASSVAALGGRPDDAMRFDAFTSPFSSQSASSTLAALSKKVSERSQQVTATPEHPPTTAHFLSLVSMTSSAALLKEVAARAAGNLLVEKKESPAPLTLGASEDVKPLLDRNQKVATPSQTMDILLPSTPKGRGKPSSQAGSPEDVGKPFQCPVCGLVIKRKSYWKRHMVIHTGLKSHQCPLCPFRCARKDNLKSHMKVHQHQDRGETFQCELCPFTSSRHFSLKLHMRCHQHFPRPDLKVKEEPCTDTEEGEGDGSLLGDITTTTGDQAMTTEASLSPALPASPSEPSECVHVKEEPQDVAVTSPFTLRRDRPGSSSSLDLSGRKASPSGPGPAPGPASLFSPDITTKTATDLLMKLSECAHALWPCMVQSLIPALQYTLLPDSQSSVPCSWNVLHPGDATHSQYTPSTLPDSQSSPVGPGGAKLEQADKRPSSAAELHKMIPSHLEWGAELLIGAGRGCRANEVDYWCRVRTEPEVTREQASVWQRDGRGEREREKGRSEEERERGDEDEEESRAGARLVPASWHPAPPRPPPAPQWEAANQKEALKGAFLVKEEPQAEEPQSSPRGPVFALGPSAHQEGSPLLAKGGILSQDIHMKVASELLMKLSENKKDTCLQKVTVKAEPMDVDTPPEVAPPPSHLLGFSTLGACEKKESLANISEPLPCPQKDLFSQDISVKMASELLFKLSEKVSKANENKDSAAYSINSPFLDDHFRQSPFSSRSKSSSPAEASSSARAAHQQELRSWSRHCALCTPSPEASALGFSCSVLPFPARLPEDLEKALVEVGNGVAPWTLSEQLYPCSVCGKVFGRQQTLSRHLSLHTEERRYKCHLCPYAAKCRANLNQHLSIHSVKLVSTEAEHIVTAVTADRGERRNCPFYYSCRVCGFQTELNAQFVSHMSLHVDKEQWMFSLCCSLCEYVGVDETEIKAHINTEHAGLNSRSPLSESKSTSSSLSALSDSLNSSEGGDVTQGNDELKSLLAPPSSASSQSSSASGMEDKSEKGFECVFCNFVCKTRSMYERHLQIHLIARMFECDVCHKFMKTPEQLLEHKKCHAVPTGGLKCPVCLYSTNRSAALGAHLKTHCRLEFRCRICQAVWASQAELDRHVRAHRLGNHYKCEQCGYLSKTANKLIEHVRVHTGERPFHCDRCAYSCKRKDNLNLHKRLKHAPRQTFGCRRCAFTTTHPFVYSRHVKKHQGGEGGGEEGEAQQDPSRLGSAHDAEPLFLLEGDGSRGLSASQALQSVAMSVSCRRPEGALAPHYLSANGASAPTTTPAARCCEQYKNYDPAHLIPLTMLFNTQRCTFHNPAPSHASSPFSRLWPRPSSQAPPSPLSPKRSFLAYLGLTARAKTI
ncbi:hypothetical protein P4O66_013139 [Electrophorus voltai]|uniref:C2H2-type domain-containing protein n=1 Tax=Electrophorus voltai TaxID=2609070 RepID=A0AAD8Z431_9TELE|nr:hypothetical protein P4O66_013139 [Electrophorus voltai]